MKFVFALLAVVSLYSGTALAGGRPTADFRSCVSELASRRVRSFPAFQNATVSNLEFKRGFAGPYFVFDVTDEKSNTFKGWIKFPSVDHSPDESTEVVVNPKLGCSLPLTAPLNGIAIQDADGNVIASDYKRRSASLK